MAKKKASPIGNPTPLAGGKALKISLYFRTEEWEVIERIARIASPGLQPNYSEIVRLAVREAGKLRKFQEDKNP